jgi:hypothetical protein
MALSPFDELPKQELPGSGVSGKYTPNHISLEARAWYLVLSSLLIIYAGTSLAADDLFLWLPGTRRSPDLSIHLHGVPAWLAGASIFSAAATLLSVVVDHYDTRNNETNYRLFAKVCMAAAVAFLVAALLSDWFVFKSGSYVGGR